MLGTILIIIITIYISLNSISKIVSKTICQRPHINLVIKTLLLNDYRNDAFMMSARSSHSVSLRAL